jgi:hypothetical protein
MRSDDQKVRLQPFDFGRNHLESGAFLDAQRSAKAAKIALD